MTRGKIKYVIKVELETDKNTFEKFRDRVFWIAQDLGLEDEEVEIGSWDE